MPAITGPVTSRAPFLQASALLALLALACRIPYLATSSSTASWPRMHVNCRTIHLAIRLVMFAASLHQHHSADVTGRAARASRNACGPCSWPDPASFIDLYIHKPLSTYVRKWVAMSAAVTQLQEYGNLVQQATKT